MFKIDKLTLVSFKDDLFSYSFSDGFNYILGTNSSGKTEFYYFVDYMFGASESRISTQTCFKDSLKAAIMFFSFENISYVVRRSQDIDDNNFDYAIDYEKRNNKFNETITFQSLKDRMTAVFSRNKEALIRLRDFAEEDLSYRHFTLFNFLGSDYLNRNVDFFDKCQQVQYAIKLPIILDYIFNDNPEKILSLKKELLETEARLKAISELNVKYEFIVNKINILLGKLNIQMVYTGKNPERIKEEIEHLQSLEATYKNNNKKPISELYAVYNDISDQIKIYENTINDAKDILEEDEKRKTLITKLNELVIEQESFHYLIDPIQSLLKELDVNISFSNYLINRETVSKLKQQQRAIKKQIDLNEYRFKTYSISDKSKIIASIEELLTEDIENKAELEKELRDNIKRIKNEIKELQAKDKIGTINQISQSITELYLSAKNVSPIVNDDFSVLGFEIKYIKKGNLLKLQISEDDLPTDYDVGSSARHTLVQLCGYLAFLKLLIADTKYPCIPYFICDHITKEFDETNIHAIGAVISEFYKGVDRKNFQIIIFGKEDTDNLGIKPDNVIQLVTGEKTGFNPFYKYKDQDDQEFNNS